VSDAFQRRAPAARTQWHRRLDDLSGSWSKRPGSQGYV